MCFFRQGCQKPPKNQFDVKAFLDNVHDIGKAYRHRAIELIKICRRFSAASDQSLRQVTELSKVLENCDKAIDRAVKSRKTASEEADHYFQKAIRRLKDYDLEFHPHANVDVVQVMEVAEQRDQQNMRKSRNQAKDHTRPVVAFHIMGALPDDRRAVVLQALSSNSGTSVLPEILWNFSHFKGDKRLTLSQNPHFYIDLPPSPDAYGSTFSSQPTERYEGRICVLTNDSGRVFFEFGGSSRVFDLVWATNDASIFKDVAGRLEGENVVGQSIRHPPPFWYSLEPAPTPSEAIGTTSDWRNVIHRGRESRGEHVRHSIHISDTQPVR